MVAGYSGTPLPKKLGIVAGSSVGLANPPEGIETTLRPLPGRVTLGPAAPGSGQDVLLLFVSDATKLSASVREAKRAMSPDTALWICWPKKTSPLAAPDLNENDVRRAGLAAGIVDVKICAVDEDWSGLKFVYRLADRPAARRTKKK